MYNACLLLLGNSDKVRDVPGVPVCIKPSSDNATNSVKPQDDNGPECKLDLKPPLWLVMIGHSGYWPVCLLESGNWMPVDQRLVPPRLWTVIWELLSILIVAYG